MSKVEIIKNVCNELGLTKKEATRIVESLFDIIKDNLCQGEKLKISGFGNFCIREKKPRRGRNPQTGDEMRSADAGS